MTNEPGKKLAANRMVESWVDPAQDLTREELESELTREGFDTARLAARFQNDAASVMGANRRKRSREALNRLKGVLDGFKAGLRGPDLQASMQNLRMSMPPQSKAWQMAAFRSLSGDVEADEEAILEDLAMLEEIIRQEEDEPRGK